MWEHTQFTPFLHSLKFSFYFILLCWVLLLPVWWVLVLLESCPESCPAIIAPSSLNSSYMPSNSEYSSLARTIDNTVVAILLTVALASLFVMVVGLLVFSLVELMGSAVVDLAVLEFSSIVEILFLPFHSHHLFQQCKKGEQLSPTVTKILPTLLPLLLLSLLSLILNYSTSCKSSKESCH